MPHDSLTVLKRCAAELFNRSARIRKFLEDITESYPAEYGQPCLILAEALLELESICIDSIAYVQRNSRDERAYNEGLRLLHTDLRDFSNAITTVHILLGSLPTPVVRPEVVGMVSYGVGDLFKDYKPSVIIGKLFVSKESDLLSLVKNKVHRFAGIKLQHGKNDVIELSLCEQNSPLAWPILTHEFGHIINRKYSYSKADKTPISKPSISSSVVRRLIKAKIIPEFYEDRVQKWAQELFSDYVSLLALGPASSMAMASLEFCLLPQIPCMYVEDVHSEYPTARWRIKSASHFISRFNLGRNFLAPDIDCYEKAFNYCLVAGARSPEELKNTETLDGKIFDEVITPLADELGKELQKIIRPNWQIDNAAVDRCLKRLNNYRPIGSQGKSRAALSKAIASYRRSTSKLGAAATRDKFVELCRIMDEVPTQLPTLLYAGGIKRLSLLSKFTDNINIKTNEALRSQIDSICDELDQLDEIVLGSIAAAGVHSVLVTHPT